MKKIILIAVIVLVLVVSVFVGKLQEDSYEISDYPWDLIQVEEEIIQFKGISIKVKESTLTETGVEYELINSSESEGIYGSDEYDLQVKVKGSWYEMKVYEDEGLMAGILSPRISYTCSGNWEQRYGKLVPGRYRIVIPITVEGTEYYMADEFVIRK